MRKWSLSSLWLLATLFFAHCSFAAETLSGECVGVTDGETIKVLQAGKSVRVRLEGIDCAESGDAFSAKAKTFTSGLVFGKVVTVRVKETDRYGRLVGRVFVDGQDVSVQLVQAGLAWHYKKYSSDRVLAQAESTARAAGIGIWSLPNPLPPWEVRAQKSQAAGTQPGTVYHGNRKSKVFHAPRCRYYNCKNCTVVFNSREEAIRVG